MKLRVTITAAFLSLSALAMGQTTSPSSRPSTIGRIAASDKDATPLEKGDAVPKLTPRSADGKPFDLNAALTRKPAVLIFYRGGWCPYCMRQLSGMQGVLDELTAAGFQVLAISPDKPEQLAKTRDERQLTYTLLSDSGAAAIQAFGLAYEAAPAQFKNLEEYSGAKHHALPVPAVYIVGTDGIIKFAHYDPDYKVRMNASQVLEQAKALFPK